ncbi:hypothetical protein T4D_16663 [Trichinella pseudospiralis]|uniref:Uncharacterized protein n=1 Tax=Trichinella pseudospiralis TaxID=6337 RepID=A0A0V1FCL2_TRIPS|nr:hypothetical protein T4D_16663 [Trichinella pseudospiralis]
MPLAKFQFQLPPLVDDGGKILASFLRLRSILSSHMDRIGKAKNSYDPSLLKLQARSAVVSNAFMILIFDQDLS